jgi:flagellar hook protein FlgE
MSIASFMYTGVSGLNSHSRAMSVISDNIANVNTVGFKASRANFSDVLGGVIGGQRAGSGSVVSTVQNIFNQGSLLGTGKATDLAIRGDGFFMVRDAAGRNAPLFTRAGQFEVDEEGFMVDLSGNRVQGYGVDSAGEISNALGNLFVNTASLAPTPTSAVQIDATLNAETAIDPAAFDLNDPSTTSDFMTAITVYDSLGVDHQLELYFKKTAEAPTAQWEVHVAAASGDVSPPGAGDRVLLGTGTLDFNTDGSLAASSLGSVNVQWSGAAAATISLDFGNPTGAGGTGVDGITTFAGESAASFVNQDGNGSGDLGGFTITNDGMLTGMYTNGETRTLGQFAIARFVATGALERVGNGLFTATQESGDPIVGRPGVGGNGEILAGSLEASNVDLAAEFVNMIAVQRGFQGNSKSITTADEMLNDVVNLKR